MNKTFLLTAVKSYTEGCMLLVINSLDDFVQKFKDYHAKKRDFMIEHVKEYYRTEGRSIVDRYEKYITKFIEKNNNKPFDFEFSTGCHFIKSGKGAGFFYDDVKITRDSKQEDCWLVLKEFLSDLPTGTHYCGDYCS